MATHQEIEARALAAIDGVKCGVRLEDDRLELKATWPEPQRAARRIAGHANAARTDAILWLVGVDEESGVVALEPTDVAGWWESVQSEFDGTAPALTHVVVPTVDGAVHALLFDTSTVPYCVKNPAFGQGGPVQLEVPWRDGTRTRTARREDLLRLLVPMTKLPEIEVLNALLTCDELEEPAPEFGTLLSNWNVSLELYVAPVPGTTIMLPVHRTEITAALGGHSKSLRLNDARYFAPTRDTADFDYLPDSLSVETTTSEALVRLPGRVNVTSRMERATVQRDALFRDVVPVSMVVRPSHMDRPVLARAELVRERTNRRGHGRWSFVLDASI